MSILVAGLSRVVLGAGSLSQRQRRYARDHQPLTLTSFQNPLTEFQWISYPKILINLLRIRLYNAEQLHKIPRNHQQPKPHKALACYGARKPA